MNIRTKPVVKNYCGYKVDVVETGDYVYDPKRGHLVRARVQYPDGFIARALLKLSEITQEEVK